MNILLHAMNGNTTVPRMRHWTCPPRGLVRWGMWTPRQPRTRTRVHGMNNAEGNWQEAARRASIMSLQAQLGPHDKDVASSSNCSLDVLDLTRLQAFEAYQREVNQPADQVDLLKCAALIARATSYPEIDVGDVVLQVDKLAEEVEKQLGDRTRYPMFVLKTIIAVLYHQKGFHGNTIDYYDPDNSYINQVLQNKAGIPITLSLLFMEVAKRVGLPMKGVNLPAHFMIQPDVEEVEVLVDAFAGEVVFVEDAAEKLSGLIGMPVRLDPATVLHRKGVAPRQFLLRMLNNLKQIYLMTSRVDLGLRIIRLMRVTAPGDEATLLLRDEGLCLYSMGRYQEAVDALTGYIQGHPHAEDASMIHTVLDGCSVLLQEQAQAGTQAAQQTQHQQQQQQAEP